MTESPVSRPEQDLTALRYELDGCRQEIARLRALLRAAGIDEREGDK